MHPSLERWRRHLAPARLLSDFRRLGRRWLDRASRPHLRVASLAPAAGGERQGRALVSFWIDPFLLPAGAPVPIAHTHFWESRRIAETWAELGYAVDVIHWTNRDFVPQAPYDVLVDVRLNLERLAPLVGDRCLRLQHIETGHHAFHNRAQRERLQAIEARRGVRLPPAKLIEENRAIETAHAATTTGNAFTIGTYAHAGKRIWRVPISSPWLYPSPAGKDFERARRRFLWFGSAGMVHKGLDLVLEAFAGMPELELVVCGPVDRERAFEKAYQRELYGLGNVRTVGWIDNGSPEFAAILAGSVGLVYPSCSEGGGGSVIVCLHAGLVPILTYETSVDLHDFGVLVPQATVEAVRDRVRAVAAEPASRLRERAVAAWEHARKEHTRERFAAGYRRACEEILAAHASGAQGGAATGG